MHEWHPTEEGWSSQSEQYTHEGDRVVNEMCSSGRDCDGRLDQYSKWECKLDELQNDPPRPSKPLSTPDWTKVSASQRDQYAEAAGY